MKRNWMLVALLGVAACGREEEEQADSAARPAPQPERVSAASGDLRVLLAEAAEARACERVRGQMLALPAEGSKTQAGTLWFTGCRTDRRGTRLTLVMEGLGWRWVGQRKEKAGAGFEVAQYVPFGMRTEMRGQVDLAYAPENHVLTLWYTPDQVPEVSFEPRGKIEVDEKGLWSEVVGAVATVFTGSPEQQAKGEADKQGTAEFEKLLAQGYTITVDACTGRVGVDLGRPPEGKMWPARKPTDTPRRARLEPGGLLLLGPHQEGKKLSLTVEIDGPGAVAVDLVCQKQAEQMAEQFAAGGGVTPPARALLTRTVSTKAALVLQAPKCPVVVATRGLAVPADVIYAWRRVPADSGTPLVRCEK